MTTMHTLFAYIFWDSFVLTGAVPAPAYLPLAAMICLQQFQSLQSQLTICVHTLHP